MMTSKDRWALSLLVVLARAVQILWFVGLFSGEKCIGDTIAFC